VSRPWSSKVTIGLARDGIALELARQSVRMLSKESVAFDSHDEVMQELLAHAETLKGRKVNLMLSNALVRYLVLPWHAGLASREDWKALAQQAFRQQFGVDADNWQVRVSLHQFGAPVVATAMHNALYDALQDASRLIGFDWSSITPAAIGMLNRLAKPYAWLLVAEPEYLLLCMRDANSNLVDVMVTSPQAGQESVQAAQLVARCIAQTGQPPRQTLVYVSAKLADVWREQAVKDSLLSPVYPRNSQAFNAAWLTQVPL
jgi:hypothetical protein